MVTTAHSAAAPSHRRIVLAALALVAALSTYVAVQAFDGASTSTADGVTPVTVAWPVAADLVGSSPAVTAIDWPVAADAGALGVVAGPTPVSDWPAEADAGGLGAAPSAAGHPGA